MPPTAAAGPSAADAAVTPSVHVGLLAARDSINALCIAAGRRRGLYVGVPTRSNRHRFSRLGQLVGRQGECGGWMDEFLSGDLGVRAPRPVPKMVPNGAHKLGAGDAHRWFRG